MKKTKILFAVPRFSVGGAEKFLIRHLAALDRERYAPSLITIFDEQKDSCADQVHIDRCFRFRSTWDIAAFFRLCIYIRKERPDVVVTHLFTANLLVRIAAILARVPVIISYEHNIYPNKRGWQVFMDRVLSWGTNRIIVDSDSARTFTAQQESIPLKKFETIFIPPLLDERKRRTPEALRSDLGIEPDAPVVVTVSRLVIDKGHTYLIDAIPHVLAQYPRARFLIGGWGPLKQGLEAQVEKLGLRGRVTLPGRVDGQEFLALADVYVDPSISTDLPVGIMEAMREGKAIVATSVGDVPVFIENGVTGLIAPPKDPPALAEAICTMLADTDLRATLGRAAKEKVAGYSLEAYIHAFDALVETLLLHKRS